MITHTQLAERIKADIIEAVAAGIIPADVADFAALHDHVDANCLGGADDLFGKLVTGSDSDTQHQAKLDAFSAVHLPAIESADAWIRSGGITEALAAQGA